MLVGFSKMTFNAVPNLGKKRQSEKHNKVERNIRHVFISTVFFYLNKQNINIKMGFFCCFFFKCEHNITTIYILIELETATLTVKDDDCILWFIVEQKAIIHLIPKMRT